MTPSLGSESFMAIYLARIEHLANVLGGIPVWEVLPASAAERAGLAFGDIVLSVNSAPTPTYADFLAAGELHLAHLEFKVFRDGELLVLCADDAKRGRSTDS